MNLTNKQIRKKARYLLDENIFGKDWLKSILVTLIMMVIVSATGGVLFFLSNTYLLPFLLKQFGHISPILLYGIPIVLEIIEILALNIFIGPLSVGLASVHLDLVRGDGNIRIRRFFDGFKNFIDNFQIGFMYTLHITLWTLLFIFPGIYVSYSYAMAFYIKKDHPDYRWQDCFDESERLMEGNRWRLFKLQISFIGWLLLGSVAFFGLGTIWVAPYQSVSNAVFYETIKAERDADLVTLNPTKKKNVDPIVVDLSNKKGLLKKKVK